MGFADLFKFNEAKNWKSLISSGARGIGFLYDLLYERTDSVERWIFFSVYWKIEYFRIKLLHWHAECMKITYVSPCNTSVFRLHEILFGDECFFLSKLRNLIKFNNIQFDVCAFSQILFACHSVFIVLWYSLTFLITRFKVRLCN